MLLDGRLLPGRLLPGQHVTIARAGDTRTFQASDRDPAQVPPQSDQSDQEATARKG
jgi:hypothetical protein